MELSISIATYQRADTKTPFYLKRALDSIFDQTYSNFKIFLIGDKYENSSEINDIVSQYPSDKLHFENLNVAKERDNYTDKKAVWSYGGVNAVNHSIRVAQAEGFKYICHLDHDDHWKPNHLAEINNCIIRTGADWMCTKSTHITPIRILPDFYSQSKFVEGYPISSKLIHSSVCMNFKKIPLLYRDLYAETGKVGLPADADLWERSRDFIKKNNLKSYYINEFTCYHDEEQYSKK
jgi:glycosyltransferase involved in cell wall biosynthesis